MSDTEPAFIAGLKLAERFYHEAVAPLLTKEWPQLAYSAGLCGDGSEILGFDSPRSTDHDWGPRLYLFLAEADFAQTEAIVTRLDAALPERFAGYAVSFPDRDRARGFCAERRSCGSARHGVECFTLASYFRQALGIDPGAPLRPRDWLAIPESLLCGVTAGAVFHDDLGLHAIRQSLAYYPDEVWYALMAAQWRRIAQEEAFVGRCREAADEVGARLLIARLVREGMRLSFLQARRYAPYTKWFGTAFARLDAAAEQLPLCRQALSSPSLPKAEAALSALWRSLARRHNQLGLTETLSTDTSDYYDRPYPVIHADRFAAALRARLPDAELREWAVLGAIGQFVDSTEVLTSPRLSRQLWPRG